MTIKFNFFRTSLFEILGDLILALLIEIELIAQAVVSSSSMPELSVDAKRSSHF